MVHCTLKHRQYTVVKRSQLVLMFEYSLESFHGICTHKPARIQIFESAASLYTCKMIYYQAPDQQDVLLGLIIHNEILIKVASNYTILFSLILQRNCYIFIKLLIIFHLLPHWCTSGGLYVEVVRRLKNAVDIGGVLCSRCYLKKQLYFKLKI